MTTLTIRPEAVHRANRVVSEIQDEVLAELRAELQELETRENAEDYRDEIFAIRAMVKRLERLRRRGEA